MQKESRLVSNQELADTAYELFGCLPELDCASFNATSGKELFQISRINEVIREYIHFQLMHVQPPPIPDKWKTVLAVRLLFARDYYLSQQQHPKFEPQLMTKQEIEDNLFHALTLHWNCRGLEWLLLHRACLPITISCGDWQLCESARWAMKEYDETSTWCIEPGNLTQDEKTWTLDNMRQLTKALAKRILRGASKVTTSTIHQVDVEEAGDFSSTKWMVNELFRLMKIDDYAPSSVWRSERMAKRLEFAEVYMTLLKPEENMTKREAFANLAMFCTLVWAKLGKKWMQEGSAPGDVESIMKWWSRYHLQDDGDRLWEYEYIKEVFEINYTTPLRFVQ